MNTRTIAAASKVIALVVLVACFCTGCFADKKVKPQLGQMQIRQLQTREFADAKVTAVMKALIAALQDEGFILQQADANLGVITAAQEKEEVDTNAKFWAEFNNGSGMGNYQTVLRYEASATVHEHGDVVRVRINIVEKSISNRGGTLTTHPVYNSRMYQNLFSKVDKSVFYEKEKI